MITTSTFILFIEKVQASVALDLLTKPVLLEQIKKEHSTAKAK
jgi:hypothetical protein